MASEWMLMARAYPHEENLESSRNKGILKGVLERSCGTKLAKHCGIVIHDRFDIKIRSSISNFD
jgi:hypothetical protein